MDFAFTPEQERIRDAVGQICKRFDDDYWLGEEPSPVFTLEHDIGRLRQWQSQLSALSKPIPTRAARGTVLSIRRSLGSLYARITGHPARKDHRL